MFGSLARYYGPSVGEVRSDRGTPVVTPRVGVKNKSLFSLPLRVGLPNARIWLIIKTATRGVYLTNIQDSARRKPAAGIRSGIGIPDHRCTTGEQHRQTKDSQSTSKISHRSVPRHESPFPLPRRAKRDPFCRTAFSWSKGASRSVVHFTRCAVRGTPLAVLGVPCFLPTQTGATGVFRRGHLLNIGGRLRIWLPRLR
jgi:hypothetical protein